MCFAEVACLHYAVIIFVSACSSVVALDNMQSVTQVKDFLAQLLHPQYAPNNDFCAVFLLEQPPAPNGGGAGDGDSTSSSSARDAAGIREAALRAKDAAAMAYETRAFLTGESGVTVQPCLDVWRLVSLTPM